jgi:hypothetical protein
MKVDYIDVENYSAISSELSFKDINIDQIINIETKKNYFRIWYKSLQD